MVTGAAATIKSKLICNLCHGQPGERWLLSTKVKRLGGGAHLHENGELGVLFVSAEVLPHNNLASLDFIKVLTGIRRFDGWRVFFFCLVPEYICTTVEGLAVNDAT